MQKKELIEISLHLLSAFLILIALPVPIYLSFKLKTDLRKLTVMLVIFLFIHAIYHVAGIFGQKFLADNVFEPLSVAMLVIFGIIYLKIRKKRQEVKA